MRTLLSRIWFALAIASALIHASTYAGVDVLTLVPPLLILHALAIVAGISGAFAALLQGTLRMVRMGAGSALDMLDYRAPHEDVDLDVDEFARMAGPNRHKAVATLLAGYAVVNFAVCLGFLEGGQPVENGGYHLSAHGHLLKTLTEDQYGWALATQTRLFTGHWMFCFYLAGALWAMRGPRSQRSLAARDYQR